MFLFQSSEDKTIREDVEKQMELCLRTSEEKNQDKYNKSMQIISKHIQNNNQKVIEIVIDTIKTTIKDDEYQPVRKYQSIKLLRDLMRIQIKNKNKSLGKYVVKKILKRLTILAEHKADSNDQERGKDIFKNVKKDQQKYSILFLNQLLLAIQEWAKTWPGVSEGTKKQFNEAYKGLITNGVQFPKQIVRSPAPLTYRGEDANRNSLSPYNSLPKRQSVTKNEQKNQPKSQIRQQKPKKTIRDTGGINEKQVKMHFNQILNIMGILIDSLGQMETANSGQLDLLKTLIDSLTQIISKGDDFVVQVPSEQIETNFYVKKITETFQYEKSISKDLKKAEKNMSQFPTFRNKYLIRGKKLIDSLTEALSQKGQTVFKQKPSLTVQIPRQKRFAQQQQSTPQQSAIKRLSVPKVSAQNMYNSNSAQPNSWVIKQRSQYNSNSHKDENENHQKYESFGIGGIGQKIRNQPAREKPKARFQKQKITPTQIQKNTNLSQNYPKNADNRKIKAQKTRQNEGKQNEANFGGFQLSGEDKQRKHQQFYLDQPSKVVDKETTKQKHEKTKDMFNDSDFNEQKKAQVEKSQKSDQQSESGNFFGNFEDKNNQQQLPVANRNPRRQKTATAKQIEGHHQKPFQNHMHSNIDTSDQNFSAFNKDRSSLEASKNKDNNMNSESEIKKNIPEDKRAESLDDPFQKSLQLNKSSLSKKSQNHFNDQKPNFWETSADRQIKGKQPSQRDNPFRKNSRNQNESQQNGSVKRGSNVYNPFKNTQFLKRSSSVLNPFDDDNKSQLSQKKSSVLNFQMNHSFTKSDKQNPFQTQSQTIGKQKKKVQNVSRQEINPFETGKQQFNPPVSGQKFDSVSQQASFKKIASRQNKVNDTSVDNPFATKVQKPSYVKQQSMNESMKFSIKYQQQNQGIDFEQFQNIGAQRQSARASQFRPRQTSINSNASKQIGFDNKNPFKNQRDSQKSRSVNFSQFGGQNQQINHSKELAKRQPTQKSINFDDFQNVGAKKTANESVGFSAFQKQKVQTKKNDFSAFDISKTSKSDFFRETSKQQKIQKAEDSKSRHSGFSGFNINLDNKSEKKDQSGVDWNDFQQIGKQRPQSRQQVQRHQRAGHQRAGQIQQNNEFNMKSDRSQQQTDRNNPRYIDKNSLKLNFSQNTSKYQSPHFNLKQESVTADAELGKRFQMQLPQTHKQPARQQQSSIKFSQFDPVEKKGYHWNPLGINTQHRNAKIYNVQNYDIQQKRKQAAYYKTLFLKQKQLLHHGKQLYNQARKVYLQKIQKIDSIIKQKESYRKILISLHESNNNKEEQIYALNEKILKITAFKQKILEKQKLLFEKSKQTNHEQQEKNTKNRTNNNKWQIFNRNLKIMRQRQSESIQRTNNFSKQGYSYSYSRA